MHYTGPIPEGENIMKAIKMAGLWKRKDKKGNLLLTGDLNNMSKILIMKNGSKKGKKDPDYFLCIAPKEKKGDRSTDLELMSGTGSKSIH